MAKTIDEEYIDFLRKRLKEEKDKNEIYLSVLEMVAVSPDLNELTKDYISSMIDKAGAIGE